jgi:hypothetical protein
MWIEDESGRLQGHEHMGDTPDDVEFFPLSAMQQLFFRTSMNLNPKPDSITEPGYRFSQSVLLKVTGNLESSHIEAAIEELVNRHSMLRSRFRLTIEGWAQLILPESSTAYRFGHRQIDSEEGMKEAIEEAQDRINFLVRQANRIPGVTIGELDTTDAAEIALHLPARPTSRWHRAGLGKRKERILDAVMGVLLILLTIGWSWTIVMQRSASAAEARPNPLTTATKMIAAALTTTDAPSTAFLVDAALNAFASYRGSSGALRARLGFSTAEQSRPEILLLDEVHEPVVVEPRPRPPEDRHCPDVHRGGRLLQVQEGGVEGGEPGRHPPIVGSLRDS